MAGFVEGMDRRQATLLPECLEDWVGENNAVRAVDVFVDALDLVNLGFDGCEASKSFSQAGGRRFNPDRPLQLFNDLAIPLGASDHIDRRLSRPNVEHSDREHAALMEDFRRTVLWRKAMAANGVKVLAMRLTPQQEHDAVAKWWAEEGHAHHEAEAAR